jgi:chemotaxis protein CheD
VRIDVGIGEYAVTGKVENSIKTYALGSCVAVILFAQSMRAVGLIHVALPDSRGHDEKAGRTPGYFADTGLPLVWNDLVGLGAFKGRVSAKLVGGASILDEAGTFDIGRRNTLAVRKWLWKKGIGILKEETGGKVSRTVEVFSDGKVLISSNRITVEL